MAVRPLKDLLKEAEEFDQSPGLNKKASSQAGAASDSVSSLAESLIGAESISLYDEGFEKTAKALNRAEALLQIQTLQKLAAFREKALKSGYTEEQVEEAMGKVAAQKIKRHLTVLMATDSIGDLGKDVNQLEKNKVPAKEVGQAPNVKDLTSVLGRGL